MRTAHASVILKGTSQESVDLIKARENVRATGVDWITELLISKRICRTCVSVRAKQDGTSLSVSCLCQASIAAFGRRWNAQCDDSNQYLVATETKSLMTQRGLALGSQAQASDTGGALRLEESIQHITVTHGDHRDKCRCAEAWCFASTVIRRWSTKGDVQYAWIRVRRDDSWRSSGLSKKGRLDSEFKSYTGFAAWHSAEVADAWTPARLLIVKLTVSTS